MYSQEKFYRSVVYFTAQLVPSGVTVVGGQSYGIRLDDPTGQNTAIAVTVPEVSDKALELGSIGSSYDVLFTINAVSYMQRDAMKDIVRSGLAFSQIPIYSDFSGYVPASGAVVEKYAALGDYFRARDMPDFNTDREKFFWTAVIFTTLDVLGL